MGRANLRGLLAALLVLAVALGIPSTGAPRALAKGAVARSALADPPAGTGLAWGRNGAGELGDGTNDNSFVPVPVSLPAGTTITAVAGGGNHSLALTSTGTVLAWGANSAGQLGNGSNTNSNVPVPVSLPAGTTITAIAAGVQHSLALTSTGTVLAWGANSAGQLGNGSNTNSNVPVPVSLPAGTTITAIAGGELHSLALTSTGAMLAWGDNAQGQLGNGTLSSSNVPVPVSLPAGTTVTAIAAGDRHSLALTSPGTVLAWGLNAFGQLGDGTNNLSDLPVAVSLPAGTTVTDISGGASFSLAVTSTGGGLAWGSNSFGQLGNGTIVNSNVPVAVSLPAGTTITAISAGDSHSLALTSTGSGLAWGNNASGQLGTGNISSSTVPVAVALPAGTTASTISAGGQHSLAIAPATPPATSTTTLGVSPTNPAVGQPVTLTAQVTCTAGTPTGTVTFQDGTTSLGTQPLSGDPATAVLTVSTFTAGSHTLQAHYNGDGTCPPSDSNQVTITVGATSTSVSLTITPAAPIAGQPITMTATVTDAAGTAAQSAGGTATDAVALQDAAPTGTVTFLDGKHVLGTAALSGNPATATLTVTIRQPGCHTLVARYSGDDTHAAAKTSVTVTVRPSKPHAKHRSWFSGW